MTFSENHLTWSGVATALTSVAHSGESLGTVSYLRRERVMMADNTVDDVPIVSGNAVRGVLRDRLADLWWANVGEPQLTVTVAHAIWSGGSLAKATREPLTGARLLDVFHVCPIIEIFGTAGGGRMVNGAARIGKLIPVCLETKHLIAKTHPQLVEDENLPTIWDLTQIEWFNRNPNYPMVVSRGDEDDPPVGARYGVETFLAGTRFASTVSLHYASPAAASLFTESIEQMSTGVSIGGRNGTGHGLVQFEFNEKPAQSSLPKKNLWKPSKKQKYLTTEDLTILARLD